MKESPVLRFLYRTVPGRMILKILVQPGVSCAAGRFLSSGASRWIVPFYVKRHGIDLNGIEVPEGGFASFNAFFTRKRKTEPCEAAPGRLISPCDGFLTVSDIRSDTVLTVKNTEYSIADLLRDRVLAEKFQNGTALIFRLTPADYHRYCYVADGRVVCRRRIPGKLHCVRPVALRTVPVFTQNSREYEVIRTKEFGTMIQMEIGALLVGKIRNRDMRTGENLVRAGEEKGYFEFGGSTILLLFQKNILSRRDGMCPGGAASAHGRVYPSGRCADLEETPKAVRKDTCGAVACLCRKLYGCKEGEREISVIKGECIAQKC